MLNLTIKAFFVSGSTLNVSVLRHLKQIRASCVQPLWSFLLENVLIKSIKMKWKTLTSLLSLSYAVSTATLDHNALLSHALSTGTHTGEGGKCTTEAERQTEVELGCVNKRIIPALSFSFRSLALPVIFHLYKQPESDVCTQVKAACLQPVKAKWTALTDILDLSTTQSSLRYTCHILTHPYSQSHTCMYGAASAQLQFKKKQTRMIFLQCNKITIVMETASFVRLIMHRR